ncbi:hypothetical protein [Pseudomonas aeruginosa]|uniref:hypothetical protein n=1 Tax=Pseudomonas aeruginosa TaxID=287 RepID=UPI00053F0C6F|nr:hypothetical protein [Pseudomonas aeruginosa]HBN9495257.1 hypothetical protein [Pseudomonas aeruginosa]
MAYPSAFRSRFVIIFLLACASALASERESHSQISARTYYESLDMSSPEASARSFVGAWAKRDFMTAYLLLSPQAEEEAARSIDDFMAHRLVPGFDMADQQASPAYASAGLPIQKIIAGESPVLEFNTDPTRRFDALLGYAAAKSKLPFALTTSTRLEAGPAEANQATFTAVTPMAETLELTFQRQPSGRWKLDRVSWPGISSEARPWDASAGSAGDTTREVGAVKNDEGQARTFYERLDMHSPDATLRTFLAAWTRQDFLSVYHLLSPAAEWETLSAMGDLRFDALVPGLVLSDLEGTPILQPTVLSPDERARGLTSNNEYTFDPARKFDVLMMRAVVLGKQPFALNAQTRAESAQVDTGVATATLRTPDEPDLAVRLVALPSGRWKVDRITPPALVDASRPWTVEVMD